MSKHNIIKYIVTLFIIGLMVGVSEILNEREIIFPEIAAIAVGSFIAPKFAWNSDYKRIFLLICISAIFGVLIVRFVPLPMAFQAIIAFALAQLIFINSGTSFAPMISAMVLPVLLQTSSMVYIISAILLTLLILIVRFLLEKFKIVESLSFKSLPLANKNTYLISLFRVFLGGIVLIVAIYLDHKFVAAPPFLVAFTEMSKADSKAIKSPFKVLVIMSACGITGALIRYIFNVKFTILPLAVSALITIFIVILIMQKTKTFIPPAGAIAILAMLIPSDRVIYYPLECIAGAFFVVLASNILVFISQKITYKKV